MAENQPGYSVRVRADSPANYTPDLPKHVVAEMCVDLFRPKGALGVTVPGRGIFPLGDERLLLRLVAGRTLCVLEKYGEMVRFTHAAPGEGTREATAILTGMKPVSELYFALSWSHAGISLAVGHPAESGYVLAEGALSTQRKLLVSDDGNIGEMAVGSSIIVTNVRVINAEGKLVLKSAAIDTWRQVTKAVRLLLEHLKAGVVDHLLHVTLANQALSMLVTGYETYCEDRFVEMVEEGRLADFDRLVQKILGKSKHAQDIATQTAQSAERTGVSPIRQLIEDNNVNFQNYEISKKAYAACYGIRFGAMVVSTVALSDMQRYIRYRHRVIHVSPTLQIYNEEDMPGKSPIFASYEVSTDALSTFESVIGALHEQTLQVPGPSGA